MAWSHPDTTAPPLPVLPRTQCSSLYISHTSVQLPPHLSPEEAGWLANCIALEVRDDSLGAGGGDALPTPELGNIAPITGRRWRAHVTVMGRRSDGNFVLRSPLHGQNFKHLASEQRNL
ncbi:hypothetical protein E2C01_046326 [Portunus trituberculatus]|uniref:Uncharacterized protein n=1 Tax=Portunus trituberculatus TaxID=210409 RepID=A0A5B7G4G3_PORTR|nr:hypothetical protein [Portunus trituberculatus]